MPSATTRKDMAAQLRAEADRIRLEAEARMEVLYEAATVLDGVKADRDTYPIEETPAPAGDESAGAAVAKMSVVEMILEAAQSFGAAVILTHEMLRDRAIEKHPDDAPKIKSGIYNAVVRLIERQEIRREPGGFQLGKKP